MNQAAVAESLKGKGIPSWKIDTLAEAIVRRAYDQKLTRTQSEILSFEQGRPSVLNIINDLMQKKANGVDSPQNRVYDGSNTPDGLTNEQNDGLQNLSDQEVDAFRNRDYIPATEDLTPPQSQNAVSEGSYEGRLNSERVLGNGQSLNDMAELYAEKVHSNRQWGWLDDFPDAEGLSKDDKTDIKNYAIEKGFIPDVPINTVTDAEGKTYKYADFEAVGLVKEKVVLPEYLWSETDSVQFKWLDRKIEGRPEGYTWHHSEKDGQMELVPTGIHNVYYHNGGRTINHWAYREGGR